MEAELKIIKKYCGDIGERIRVCREEKIARTLKECLCRELETNCRSQDVHHFLAKYVDRIIHDVFDANGKNKFLEVHND